MNASFTTAEIQTLLGRTLSAEITAEERAAIAGSRVLITGAGGSIGAALAREIAGSKPAALGLLDHSELALFTIRRELMSRWPSLPLHTQLADVTRTAYVAQACAAVRPEVLYHAAAYKHVGLAEEAADVTALVNVIGTSVAATAARAVGARFVLISSDKAAEPAGVMGATKRLAELVALSMASPDFRPIVVRFGNVAGSSGSVLQILRDAVRGGAPIRLTDPDATRYFMAPEEAVTLVLRADRLGRAGEVFWLDVAEPLRLGDLAARLLALEADCGFRPVPIEIMGLGAGEKLHERLTDPWLTFSRTVDAHIRVARDGFAQSIGCQPLVRTLRRVAIHADRAGALALLARHVPGFRPGALGRPASESAVRASRGRGRAA